MGLLTQRLRLSPIVGYLVAGVLIGPHTPGYVGNLELAHQLAEIGVILLMFGVGLHFSLKDLLAVKAIAIPGAVVQIAAACVMGLGLGFALGWPVGGGLVLGLALSVASTVVLLRALQDRRLLDTDRGRIAIGWLIVEDLAMVLTLVLLPALAGILKSSKTLEHSNVSKWLEFPLPLPPGEDKDFAAHDKAVAQLQAKIKSAKESANVAVAKKATQPDGTWAAYTYDAAHRLTDVADNQGNSVHYTLDAMGNRTQEDYKDPSGTLRRTITRVIDALNRVQTVSGAPL